MELDVNGCPYEQENRASLCESCCENEAVPPCAKHWLRSRLAVKAPTPIHMPVWEKKAA